MINKAGANRIWMGNLPVTMRVLVWSGSMQVYFKVNTIFVTNVNTNQMTITKSEAIVWLVSHVGKMDGTFSVNESMDLEEISQYKLHLKSAKASGIEAKVLAGHLNYSSAMAVIATCTAEEKKEIMHFCETIVKGDGERYTKEIEFMSKVSSELGL
jgi:uncharacterized tellurite resistance protein B-like protein